MKCKKMELKEEPYMVIGAFASEAYKTFATSRKAREVVRILAKADMDILESNKNIRYSGVESIFFKRKRLT